MFHTLTKSLALAAACAVTLGCATTATADDHGGDKAKTGGEALTRLMEGNQRFVNGEATATMSVKERAELAKGQSPYAIIVSCADSRVAPELAFDANPGDLFVIRVAGNVVDDYELASIEYAVAVLESPLLVIMGHESCGAVDAAVKAEKGEASFPGQIHDLIEDIRPAVRKAMEHETDNLLMKAIQENVRLVVDQMENSQPIVGEAIKSGKLKVVPAVYDLDTGKVSVVSMDDMHHEGHGHEGHNHGS
jgi:carbonic anhydrase